MEPSFSIDRSDLLVSPDNRENVLREDRVTVGIWVEKAYAYSAETEKQEGDWKFLFEWGVSFKALESIGNDVSNGLVNEKSAYSADLSISLVYFQSTYLIIP